MWLLTIIYNTSSVKVIAQIIITNCFKKLLNIILTEFKCKIK